ncbi:MAG TPA: hypothetical protein VNE38_21770 [Ktedonobacteraceae bacterium]|nr:hypothetical protein [Ktedonobacteraceae bacterium]
MKLAFRMSKAQLVLFILIILSLLVTAMFVVHASMPELWHATVRAVTPDILSGWH